MRPARAGSGDGRRRGRADRAPGSRGLVARLLRWYRASRRDLPWRRTTDPYRIWVSEAMLQQTRVEVAGPYFERFVRELPTVASLATAPLDRVLALWSGLGYYERARSLHTAARECVARHGGSVPDDPDAFGRLRGVGPYTRAAVQSIAFGRPLAVVDGNVVRVVARLRTLPGDAKSGVLRARVAEIASALLPPAAPGDFNQALMELGATVCTPRSPRCGACPVACDCRAARAGDPERWPARAVRKRARVVRWEAALVERRGRVLLARRGDEGRWKRMWELPWTDGAFAGIRERYGLELAAGAEVARVRHCVLDERITVVVRRATLARTPRGKRFAWVAPAALGDHAMASVWRKVLEAAPPPRPPLGSGHARG